VVGRRVWSRNLVNVEALAHWRLSRQKTNKQTNKRIQLHYDEHYMFYYTELFVQNDHSLLRRDTLHSLNRYGRFGISTKLGKFLEKGRKLLKRSGNFGYPSLGDTGRYELCFANKENRLRPVAILVQWVASSVLSFLCIFKESQFCKKAHLLYVCTYYWAVSVV
jgi:hypothetical protein